MLVAAYENKSLLNLHTVDLFARDAEQCLVNAPTGYFPL